VQVERELGEPFGRATAGQIDHGHLESLRAGEGDFSVVVQDRAVPGGETMMPILSS
jgi:hypothetical protein